MPVRHPQVRARVKLRFQTPFAYCGPTSSLYHRITHSTNYNNANHQRCNRGHQGVVVPSPLPVPAVPIQQQYAEMNSLCLYGQGWEESHFKHSLPFSVTAGNIMRPLAEQYLNQYHFMNLNYCTRSDFATSHFQP